MIAKPDIKDLTIGQLGEWLTRKGIAAYRAGQILRWIYKRQADGFDEMSDHFNPKKPWILSPGMYGKW